MRETEVVIAGGGISGLKTGLELSKIGFTPTIVETKPYGEAEKDDITYSTPIIFDSVAKDYGITFDPDTRITRFESSFLTARRAATTLLLNAYLHYFNRCLYAPSIRDMSDHLYDQASHDGNINFVRGKVTNVILDGNKVRGVQINGKEQLDSDLVIDATGRTSVISRKIAAQNAALVTEKKTPQPSTILGAYVSLPDNAIEEYLPKGRNVIYSEQLPNELQFIFAPAAQSKRNTLINGHRYLLLVEGNRETIEEACKMGTGEISEKRLEVIKALTEGSRWKALMEQADNPKETILFYYADAVVRKLKTQGAVLVGDARMNTSPIVGAGLFFLNDDIKRLIRSLKENPGDISDAVNVYERSQIVPSTLKWAYSKRKYKDSYTAKSNNL